VLWPAFAATREAGYLTGTEERLAVTPLGRAEVEKLVVSVHAWLAAELADWGAADDTKLTTALTALARHLVDDDSQTYTPIPSPDSLRAGPTPIEGTRINDISMTTQNPAAGSRPASAPRRHGSDPPEPG
jgi:hypothetical protein